MSSLTGPPIELFFLSLFFFFCRVGFPLTHRRALHDGRPVFLVLTGACQFGHGVGGFATNFIHSEFGFLFVESPASKKLRLGKRSNGNLVWVTPIGGPR